MQLNALCKNGPVITTDEPGKLLLTHIRGFKISRKTLLCMKITAFFLLVFCMQVSATTLAQNVTLSERHASLEKVINDIKQQTGYSFFYNQDWLSQAQPVNIDVKQVPLDKALKLCFANQPVDYVIVDKTIVLKLKEVTKNESPTPQVPVNVTGKVQDELGNPMSGVTIRIEGTTNGTISDATGKFSLNVPDAQTNLVFTYIGYEPQTIRAVDIPTGATIILKVASNNLKEVVVNKGYYSTSQLLNTGDVGSVNAKQIENQPVQNPLAALEGQVAGVFIQQNNGFPGASFTVQLRGQNSIAQGNDPLYVIDGVPYPSEILTAGVPGRTGANTSSPGGGSPFSYLNDADILTINVLKDADATAIYGSRGANGVVLITTKKGNIGKTMVNLNLSQGIGEVPHFLDLMNTQQYLQMRHEAIANDGQASLLTPQNAASFPDLLEWDTTRYTNWQKVLLGGTAQYTDAQASISGGNLNTQFVISGGYHRQTTVLPGDWAEQKGTLAVSINHISDDQKFKLTFSGNFASDDATLPYADPTGIIPGLAPDAPPPFNADGTINYANQTWTNPYTYLQTSDQNITTNLVSNSSVAYTIIKGLELKLNMGYNSLQQHDVAIVPSTFYPTIENMSGYSKFLDNDTHSWVAEPQLNYNLTIGKGKLNFLAGAEWNQITNIGNNLNASNFSSDALLGNEAAAGTLAANSPVNSLYKYQALYSRLSYNYEDKYVLNLTARRDGSSRFGPANEFHDFGAIGAAWIFSNETVFKNIPFLSLGKLRASYGTTGNDQIGDYTYYDLYANTYSGYPYQGVVGVYPQQLYNPNLQWETTRKIEGALELGFLNDRINLDLSYYRNRSSNELVSFPVTSTTGFTSIESNLPAVVQNTGWELTLNTTNVNSEAFRWTTSANFTIPRNKLVAYPNLASSPYAQTLAVGEPITGTKALHYLGVDPKTGHYQFASANGGATTTPNFSTDKTSFVNTSPKYYGGLTNDFVYKGFDLSISIIIANKMDANFSYALNRFSQPGSYIFNQFATVLGNEWQKPGDNKIYQAFTTGFNGYIADFYRSESDGGFLNTTYLKLRNVALTYKFPTTLTNKMHVHGLSVFVKGENLLTVTNNYFGYDPETNNNQVLPNLRIITAGINLSL